MVQQKILFVDDETSLRDVVQRLLTRLGYEVVLAADAEQALEILKTDSFPVIITDLRMPGEDGDSLCRMIRKRNPEAIVYALSAYMASYRADSLEQAGFDGFLCKPVNRETLKRAIEGAFSKYAKRSSRPPESAR